jgi:hypothetical protein
MGMDLDAMLVFGIVGKANDGGGGDDTATLFPWEASDEDEDDREDEVFETYLARRFGVDEPDLEWAEDAETKAVYRAYWEKKQEIAKAFLLDATVFGYSDYTRSVLYLKGTKIETSWSEAHPIRPEDLSVSPEDVQRFKEACAKLGIENAEPRWLLLARYW